MTTALPIRQNNSTPSQAIDTKPKSSSPSRPSIYPISPSSNALFADHHMGGSPMSFGMSFTGAGGMMKSFKQSFLAGGRFSQGDRAGFGSYKNGTGSFIGYMDESVFIYRRPPHCENSTDMRVFLRPDIEPSTAPMDSYTRLVTQTTLSLLLAEMDLSALLQLWEFQLFWEASRAARVSEGVKV
jgi:hypothetical protein